MGIHIMYEKLNLQSMLSVLSSLLHSKTDVTKQLERKVINGTASVELLHTSVPETSTELKQHNTVTGDRLVLTEPGNDLFVTDWFSYIFSS